MSFEALAWAKRATTGSSTNKLVLLLLAECHNSETRTAWPSVQWLADHAELSRRSVQRALRDLEYRGLIARVGWPGTSLDRTTQRYAIPALEGGVTVSPQGRHSDAGGASQCRPNTLENTSMNTTPPTPPSRQTRDHGTRLLKHLTERQEQ